jgi:hypothetical protein
MLHYLEPLLDQVVFLVLGLIFYRYSRKMRKQVPDKRIDLFQDSRGGVPFSISSLTLTHVDN